MISDQQGEWKRHRWQKVNTKQLQEEVERQLTDVKALPSSTHLWDIYMSLYDSIVDMQVYMFV